MVTDCPYLLVGGGCSEGEYRTKNGHSQPSGIMNRQRGQTKYITLSGTLNDNTEDVRKGKMFEHNNIKFSDWLPDVYRGTITTTKPLLYLPLFHRANTERRPRDNRVKI